MITYGLLKDLALATIEEWGGSTIRVDRIIYDSDSLLIDGQFEKPIKSYWM